MEEKGIVTNIAEYCGSGDQSVRLIMSLLAGYPLAFIYRNVFHARDKNLQHIFFTMCGLSLCYFNFGIDTLHSVLNIAVIWGLLQIFGGTRLSVAIALVFNTLYLLKGYMHVTGDDYDISWATPHCVLTLRLTGVVLDVYDGRKSKEKLSSEQVETVLQKTPSLLEMAGHVYFFGGFVVGPQFSMRRYQSFVNGDFCDKSSLGPPHNIHAGVKRLLLGVLYIGAFQILCASLFTHEYMLTDQFQEHCFVSKCVYILIWGKLTLSKYVGVWLVAEGSCILTGLTYNGKDINGNSLWNGCSNAKIYELETCSTFREMISGFNVNTNNWMARYIYKRLRFLGSKQLSQAVTLTYLSVWHGLQPGYYMNFFLEFLMLNGETQLVDLLRLFPHVNKSCQLPVIKQAVYLMKKILVQFFVSYALVSFVQLQWGRMVTVYSSVYYIGHVTFLLLPLLCVLLKSRLKPSRPLHTAGGDHKSTELTANGKKEN